MSHGIQLRMCGGRRLYFEPYICKAVSRFSIKCGYQQRRTGLFLISQDVLASDSYLFYILLLSTIGKPRIGSISV
jgi:hypothetical protein